MFKWTDGQGKVHYTDSVSKIPYKFRKGGKRDFKTLRSAPGNAGSSRGSSSGGGNFSIAVPKGGVGVPLIPMGNGNFAVDVIMNGSVRIRLMLDTGASMVVLHPSLAPKLGIRSLANQPKIIVSTAGGQELNSIGVINSVKVGQAMVPDVEATFNSHMEPNGGLLGMTFLNDFRFEIDRQSNLLLLKPLRPGNDATYGDRPLSWWKEKYRDYLSGLNRASYNKANTKQRTAKVEEQKMLSYYQDLVERLDRRATRARLPDEYRDPFRNRKLN